MVVEVVVNIGALQVLMPVDIPCMNDQTGCSTTTRRRVMKDNFTTVEKEDVAFWEVMYGVDDFDASEEPHWFEKFDRRSKKYFDDYGM